MASNLLTEQVYSSRDRAGVAVLVGCCALSLISVLGVFIILGASLIPSPRDKYVFVRTQTAKFLSSLLLCNLIQSIGGLLNIAWLVENRVYTGVTCTAQAALKQIGNTGPAIFTFLIAFHTFCLLFLRRKWADRTCHIVHIVSWALLLLELCIEHFVFAEPERGPYYGITTSGYWCWISPKYLIERYTTDYLFMVTSATFSFILYVLIFFRLRGNISVSRYKISFHRRPDIWIGRMRDGTSVVTDNRRIEAYLDTVAKHMLWYPVAYTFLILPTFASRLSTFHGKQVPFTTAMLTSAVFMLHGFFNSVLFCTTRHILPESWRQRFDLSIRGGRGDTNGRIPMSTVCWFTRESTTTAGIRQSESSLSVDVEYPEIKDAAALNSSGSCPSSTSSTMPTVPSQARIGSGQRANAHEHYIRHPSPAPRATRASIPMDIDVDGRDSDLDFGVYRASMERTEELEVPQHPGCAPSDHESGTYGLTHV